MTTSRPSPVSAMTTPARTSSETGHARSISTTLKRAGWCARRVIRRVRVRSARRASPPSPVLFLPKGCTVRGTCWKTARCSSIAPMRLCRMPSDGRGNVYEYENGHVYAISDVAGGSESFFMDASANGENVFFGTADQLLPQDTSNNVAVYDARVDGGFPVTVAPLACTTAEACRTASPPTPAVFGAPPSATFSGPGNVTPATAGGGQTQVQAARPARQKLAKALKVCPKTRRSRSELSAKSRPNRNTAPRKRRPRPRNPATTGGHKS